MPGYPDWQKLSRRAGDPLINIDTQPGNAPYDSGILSVANFQQLLLTMKPSGTSLYTVDIVFYMDAAGAHQVTFTPIIFGGNGGTLVMPVAVVAPYFRVQVSTGSPGGADTYTVRLAPSTNDVSAANLQNNQLLQVSAASIAAAGTLTTNASGIIGGPVSFSIGTAAAASIWELQQQSALGAWTDIMRMQYAASVAQQFTLGLPLAPVRLFITNSDTTGHTFTANLSSLR